MHCLSISELCTPGKEGKVDSILAIEKEVSTTHQYQQDRVLQFIKVSGRMYSIVFKRRLGLSFAVIISTTVKKFH